MSTTENLGINITSNVAPATRGLNDLSVSLSRVEGQVVAFRTTVGRGTTVLTTFSNGAATAAANVGRLAPPLSQFAGAMDRFVAQARAGQLSFTGLTGGAQNAGRAIQSTTRSIQSVARPTNSAANSLQNLGRIASDSPFGFIAIQNNIDPLIQSFNSLRAQLGSNTAALKAIGSSLVGPAGIALGFSVVSAAATALIQKYGSLSNAFTALNPFISRAAKLQVELSNAQLEGGKSAQEEIFHLNSLYSASQNLNVPLQDRKAIVSELQKQYPETFNNYTREEVLAGKAAGAIDGLRKSLIALSVSRATEKLAAKQGEELVALRMEAQSTEEIIKRLKAGSGTGILLTALGYKDEAQKAKTVAQFQEIINQNKEKQLVVEKNIADIQEVQNQLAEKFGAKAFGIKGATTTVAVLAQLAAALEEVDTKAKLTGATTKDVAKDKLPLLNKAFDDIAAVGDGDAKKALANIGAQIKSLGAVSEAKGLPSVADILKKLGIELAAIDAQFALTGGTMDNVAKDKIATLQKALEQLVGAGLKPTSPVIQKVSDQINNLSDSILGATPIASKYLQNIGKGIRTSKVKNLTSDELAKILGISNISNLQLSKPVGIEVDFQETPALENLDTFSKQFVEKTAQMSAAAKAAFKKNYIVWGDALTSGLEPAIINVGAQLQSAVSQVASGIGEAVGNIISGKDGLAGALASIVTIMADFIVSFGKSLIEAATLKIIAEKSLLANPYVALAAGIGAVAIGTALKNKTASFARGGTAFGTQLAVIGDNPGREEHIIPSEVLDKMSGSGNGDLRVSLSGSDFVVWYERQKRMNG